MIILSKAKKLTLADIIAKKEQILDSRKSIGKIFIPSLDGYIVVQKPDRALLADAQEIKNGMDSNVHIVYNCVVEPDLKDKDTQKEFGVHTPKELLQVIMNDGEIGDVAASLMTLAGYGDTGVELIKDIKN